MNTRSNTAVTSAIFAFRIYSAEFASVILRSAVASHPLRLLRNSLNGKTSMEGPLRTHLHNDVLWKDAVADCCMLAIFPSRRSGPILSSRLHEQASPPETCPKQRRRQDFLSVVAVFVVQIQSETITLSKTARRVINVKHFKHVTSAWKKIKH